MWPVLKLLKRDSNTGDIFWTSCVHSIHVLYPGGIFTELKGKQWKHVQKHHFDILNNTYCFRFTALKLSAASRCILLPFEQYRRTKKYALKVLETLFPYIFHVKTIWNIVYENKNLFKRHKCPSPNANILLQPLGFGISLNYQILYFKKTVCPKNVWMRHWH